MLRIRQHARHGCCSTAGRRAINEDRAATFTAGGGRYVAVVADGMGGAAAGDVASDLALNAFVRSVRAASPNDEQTKLHTAFAVADRAIRDALTPERQGMGSTLVAAIVHDRGIWIGNIGDSRAVLVTRDDVISLSTPHSVVGEALSKGEITELEALRHPERHVVSRAIGDGDSLPDMQFHSLNDNRGTLVLLGSDGLFNFIGDTEILELAEDSRTALDVVERVVRRAVDNGSDDNVSAAAILLDPPHGRRWPLAAAVLAALVAAGAAAYVERDAVVRQLVRPLARLHNAWIWRQGHSSRPARVTRVRLSAIGNRYLRVGMTGTLCAPSNECFCSWTVIAVDGSSLVLELRVNDVAAPRSKS
jgi:PPM family protein phosphatase